MAKPPLPVGSWGEISTWVVHTDTRGRPVKYKSQAKFRDHDGHVRQVSKYGKTRTAAERALQQKLHDRAKTNQSGELSAMHKINHLLDLWEKRFEGLVADGTRSPTSLDTYRRAIKNHIRPALGELRIGEATTSRIDTVLARRARWSRRPQHRDRPPAERAAAPSGPWRAPLRAPAPASPPRSSAARCGHPSRRARARCGSAPRRRPPPRGA